MKKKEEKQVTPIQILRHVIKTGTPYRLANGEEVAFPLYWDDIKFDEANYCVISKSRFAEDIGVHLSQITRWLAAGMDTALYRDDPELLVWWRCYAWLKRNRKEWMEAHERNQMRRALAGIEVFLAKHKGEKYVPIEVMARDMAGDDPELEEENPD